VDRVFDAYAHLIDEWHILPDNASIPGEKTPPMYQSEVYSIILNLYTNAIKAVQKRRRKREIRVETIDNSQYFIIRMLDSGKGVKKTLRKEVFEPFYTTSDPDVDFGLGTGLGLTLVQDIVEDYGGEVEFIDPPKGWNACIEVRLPKVI
ncbi:MAG: ATP-binding protein, partial [Candidatus Thorarchaeota archaeon]